MKNEELLKEHCFYTYTSDTEVQGRFNFVGKANNNNFLNPFIEKYRKGPAVIWKCITTRSGKRDYRISISSDIFLKPNPKCSSPANRIDEFKQMLG